MKKLKSKNIKQKERSDFMECNDVKNNISLYIDEELEYDESEEIRNHLNTCQLCFDEYEQILRNRNALREVPVLPLPEGFKEELHKKLIEKKKIVSMKSWKKYSLIAALFLIALVSVLERDLISDKMSLDKDGGKAEQSTPMEENEKTLSGDENDEQMEMKSSDLDSSNRMFSMEDSADESPTDLSESDEQMNLAAKESTEEDVPMGLLRSDKPMSLVNEESLKASVAIIIEDTLEGLSIYLDEYQGSFDLKKELFEAALDSSTPELEIDVPMEEFDAIFNYLAEYSGTINYLQIDSSKEIYDSNSHDKDQVIIIMTRE